jgi:hypothetical protein
VVKMRAERNEREVKKKVKQEGEMAEVSPNVTSFRREGEGVGRMRMRVEIGRRMASVCVYG